MHRRKFVNLAASAAVGVSISQCMPVGSRMLVYIPFLAEMLGYGLILKTLSDYFTGKPNSVLRGIIPGVDAAMANGGFIGERTPIYVDGEDNIMYAIENADGVDACLAFYRPDSFTTMVEGPTVIALSKGSQDLRREHNLEIARQILVPNQEITQNRGRLSSKLGYSVPTRYYNKSNGFVDINYTRTSDNTGSIKVHAESGPGVHYRAKDGTPSDIIYDKEFDFSFPTLQI